MRFKRTCAPAAGPQDWVSRALCRQVDPEVFFPPRNTSSVEAVRVCRRCPVPVECLTDALATGDLAGMRAGLSGRQRKTLVRQRQGARGARAARGRAHGPAQEQAVMAAGSTSGPTEPVGRDGLHTPTSVEASGSGSAARLCGPEGQVIA